MMDTEHLNIEAEPAFADVRFLEDRLYEGTGFVSCNSLFFYIYAAF